MLEEQLIEIANLISPTFHEKFKTEISLIPRYFYYRLGLREDRDLPGHQFENCRMVNDEETGEPLHNRQKTGYLILRVILVYLFKKFKSMCKDDTSLKFRIFDLLTRCYNFAEFANFMAFVCGGRYPQLIHRILEIKYVSRETLVWFVDLGFRN